MIRCWHKAVLLLMAIKDGHERLTDNLTSPAWAQTVPLTYSLYPSLFPPLPSFSKQAWQNASWAIPWTPSKSACRQPRQAKPAEQSPSPASPE